MANAEFSLRAGDTTKFLLSNYLGVEPANQNGDAGELRARF
jgi:hypothetical protein